MLGLLGIQVSESFVKWAGYSLLVIALVTGIFFTYRHFENSRAALVAQAQQSAVATVEQKVDAASNAMLKAQEAEMQKQIEAKELADAKAQSDNERLVTQIDDLPLDLNEPAAPASPAVPTKTKSKTHGTLAPQTDAAARVRSLDTQLNRMLERSAAF